jgi:hypothetical protein
MSGGSIGCGTAWAKVLTQPMSSVGEADGFPRPGWGSLTPIGHARRSGPLGPEGDRASGQGRPAARTAGRFEEPPGGVQELRPGRWSVTPRGARSVSAGRPAAPRRPPPPPGRHRPGAARPRATGCPALVAGGTGCRTRQHTTTLIDVRRVQYRFHPWFGRDVHVLARSTRQGQAVCVCRIDAGHATTLELPSWMLDSAACSPLTARGEARVGLDALSRLRDLPDSRPAPATAQLGEALGVVGGAGVLAAAARR